ncbi:trafficking protein particle complex subunit 9-like [Plakobranchus ocellatus]|uniref:Trafficking protein particle complex subunit 9-like n=1 Tax=Plakobranchus ocellatus TaxID=259542 RepID=A0AAV4DNX0_9GAST|nr:trafficking protein particle complex subunit 9-like [Plakobranchus ocellatus]
MEVPRLDPSQVDTTSRERQDRVPLHYRSRPNPDPHSQALASYVDIRWSIPSAKAQGKVGIDYLTWTPEQLLVLMATKVQWEVHLNERCFLPSSRCSFRSGELLNVTVMLENACEDEPSPCALSVQPCQVNASGDLGLTLESFAVIGSSVQHIDKILTGTTVRHSCSFVFFTPGFYGLSIICSQLQPHQLQQQQPEQQHQPQLQSSRKEQLAEMQCTNSPSKDSQTLDQRKPVRWVCGMPVRFEIT